MGHFVHDQLNLNSVRGTPISLMGDHQDKDATMSQDRFRIGDKHSTSTVTQARHSAAFYGNEGVDVVATPALVGLLEAPCHLYLIERAGPGEGSVGTKVDVEHLAAAPTGAEVVACARVAAIAGRRVTFDVEARWGETVLMRGQHQRAVVDLEKFFAGLPKL
jgi:predicted thioesterase